MNLSTAISSAGYGGFIRDPHGIAEVVRVWHRPERMFYDVDDLRSETWEVKEETSKAITITAAQFWDACLKYHQKAHPHETMGRIKEADFWFMAVAKSLGLEGV